MKTIALSIALITTAAVAEINRPIPDNERITRLLEGNREITGLGEMEKLGLNQGASRIDLWSGPYWPHYQGALAVRYRDPQVMQLMAKKEQFDKFKELNEKTPAYSYSGRENLLSPAEKYDLLVGDPLMSLTKYSWDLGDKTQKLGKVPTWRGICDGWSAASQMMPRPTRAVTLNNPAGIAITFYPEDIKALGSQLYARAQENVIFLGKRCYPVVGMFSGGCDETNAGAFHKAIANRVGKLQKSFVADLSTSSEVWNYPVKSYKFTYYNVFTEEESANFKEAMELFQKKNRFQKSGRRDERTYAIVGVKAELQFSDMRAAHLLQTDGPGEDKLLTKTYYYDLELDRNFNILGGEWISGGPDFIWAPNDLTYPLSVAEKKEKPVKPSEITKAAQISSKVGQPLSVVVEKLFELAK